MVCKLSNTVNIKIASSPLFLATYLLPKTDPGSRVEREKNEWVGRKILVKTLVNKSVGIKFQSYSML